MQDALREPFDGARGSPPDERVSQLLRELAASRKRLLAVVAGVSEEQFKRRPMPEAEATAGDWSIAEVLAHLLASEQRAGQRIESLLANQAVPRNGLGDEERNAEARQGRAVPVPQIIHGLLAARRHLERNLMETGTARTPEGVLSFVRQDVIEHEAAHATQIEAVKAALGSNRTARG